MTPEQWRQARDLFEQALEQRPGDVDAWLSRQGADSVAIADVRSLLQHHSRAEAFLETPVLDRRGDLLADDARFAEGDTIGSYRIVREIGRGGMGHVYLATDTRLARQVALKVLAPGLVRDQAHRDRLRREARAAASLSHPGICTVYALEEIDGEVVIATEYIEGRTLRDEIDSHDRPGSDQLTRTARELGRALAAAHARGITHRDLKPENVMRAGNGAWKILDFGLAAVEPGLETPDAPARVTTPGTIIGTPAYMAPEQLDGRAVDARTDIFAIGVLLYEYATGLHPFAAPSALASAARILEGEPEPLASCRPDVPAPFAAAVDRCLRKRPSERFGSASDFVAALDCHSDLPVAPDRSVGWWRTHLAAAIALYTIAMSAAWLVKEWNHGPAAAGFVLVATLAVIGGVLRGHLLFAERTHDRATLDRELRRVTPPLIGVDVAIGIALVVEGLWVSTSRSVPGVLIVGLGVGIALTRLVLERTTTQVAFGDRRQAGNDRAPVGKMTSPEGHSPEYR